MVGTSNTLNLRLHDHRRKRPITVDLREYVIGAVAASMPPEFPLEALKAQAICARTNAIKHMTLFGGSGCNLHEGHDMCTDPLHCQGYYTPEKRQEKWGGKTEEYHAKICRAVEETRGIILTYSGNIINAVYHCACGGCTEDSENVWGNKVSYLRKVECIYCRDSPHWENTTRFTVRELKRRLNINFDDRKTMKCEIPGLLENLEHTGAGRVKEIKIGDMNFKGDDVKALLGLSSTRLSWRVSALCFHTLGKGHGLGMCQYGARGMAMLGFPVDEILMFYFTGVGLEEIEMPTSQKPLIGKSIVIDPGHGGASGNLGPMGLSEGYVNLEIAKLTEKILRDRGAKVHMTRDKNVFTSLSERVKLSNEVKPDIMLSIHQNMLSDPAVGGIETFYYPGDGEGKKVSAHVHSALLASLGLKDQGLREADLYILRESNSPAVLVNTAFLSNPEEERMLSEPEFRQRISKALCQGIWAYYRG